MRSPYRFCGNLIPPYPLCRSGFPARQRFGKQFEQFIPAHPAKRFEQRLLAVDFEFWCNRWGNGIFGVLAQAIFSQSVTNYVGLRDMRAPSCPT